MKRIAIFLALALMAFPVMAQAVYGSFGNDEIDALHDQILKGITGATHQFDYTVDVTRMGARPDGVRDCLPAFKKALARIQKQGGGRIVVPAGTYLLKGPLHLVSNLCLELQEGATLRFDPDPKYYLPMVRTSWEGTFVQNYSPFIYAYGLHDVILTGRGTIDGNASTTFSTWRAGQDPDKQASRRMNHEEVPVAERNFGEGHLLRPQMIQFFDCERITVEDVFMTNSPFWCLHLLRCDNVIVRRVRYDAKLVNNDGIDPEYTRNLLIEEVEFDNGDDNVAIKAGRDNDGWASDRCSENIIIRNCRFKGLHAVVMGSEMSAGVRNVFIEDCTTRGYTKRGLYIKTNPDRGGFVENIFLRDCYFEEVEDLFYVTSLYAGEGADNNHFSTIRNIRIQGLTCPKVTQSAIALQGTVAKPVTDVVLVGVKVGFAAKPLSMVNTGMVQMMDCVIGDVVAGAPSLASDKDNLFK
ncbi:MAG: glycoside hydrolase family 28 protein [Bacteroidales bacterium]|nr:glycoside hydrolase family 28 protein [Bacteroidales bacterium]